MLANSAQVPHLGNSPSSSCFLRSDSCRLLWAYRSTEVQKYSFKDGLAGLLKVWPCEYGYGKAITTALRSTLHLIWNQNECLVCSERVLYQLLQDFIGDTNGSIKTRRLFSTTTMFWHHELTSDGVSAPIIIEILGRDGDQQVDKKNTTAGKGGKENEQQRQVEQLSERKHC